MRSDIVKPLSPAAAIVFDLLNPIAFGFFVGGLIFDVIYAKSPEVMWFKGAAWLISIGLVFAIIPRLINLVHVWFTAGRSPGRAKAAFFFYLVGVIAAIVNAFVHSRDAFGVIPEGVWLSIATVVLMAIGNVLVTLQQMEIGKVQA